jgi:superfamily I DNA/RNA helicase
MRTVTRLAATAEHWQLFETTIGEPRRNAAGWPSELDLVCRWYAPHLEPIHEDAALREADLLQLAQIASTYPSGERFLTELTLDPPDATTDEAGVPLLDENYVILSTIHSAKGQKRAAIFLLNTVDGCLPSDLATGSTPAAICLIEFQRWRELGFCKRRYLRTNCPWREGSGAPQTRQGNSRSTVSGPASPLIKW